jgi:TRAP-type C4-dicarboxylate transport system substrate-binding protein
MNLNRRNFLKLSGGITGAAFAGSFVTTSASAAKTITGVTYIPQSYKDLSFGSNGFVEQLQKNAADVVKVDFYDSGKLLKADEQLPALRSGTIDFMFHTTSYITRSSPILGITGLPNVVDELYKHPDRIAKGSPLFALINEQLAKENLVALSLGGTIMEPEFVWSTKAHPIKSIADIKGKKVRVVSFEATGVMEKFGAGAVRIPSSELYLALQRGTIDAAVANIGTVIGRSLQEQIGAVYKLPVTAYGIGIFVEKRKWDSMDPAVKKAMQFAADWFDAESAKTVNTKIYPNDFWPKIKAAGIEVIEPSQDDITALDKAADQVVAKWKGTVGEDIGQRAIDLALGKSKG